MQHFHTIDVSEMCGEVVMSQGVILSALCASASRKCVGSASLPECVGVCVFVCLHAYMYICVRVFVHVDSLVHVSLYEH